MPNNLTPEGSAKGRQNSLTQGLTRRWYKQVWLAIFRGEIKVTSVQTNALRTFGELMHWHRPRQIRSKEKVYARKPMATQELVERLQRLSKPQFVAELPHIAANRINELQAGASANAQDA